MKQYLCILLAVSMVISYIPMCVRAEETIPNNSVVETEHINNAAEMGTVEDTEQFSVSEEIADNNVATLTETTIDENITDATNFSSEENTALTSSPTSASEDSTSEAKENKIPVTFICSPQDLILQVYYFNGNEKVYAEQDSDGIYHLLPGIYYYDAKQEGFADKTEKSFEITEDYDELEIQITLTPNQVPDKTTPSVPIESQDTQKENEIPVPVSTADSHLAEYISLMPAGSQLSVDYSDAPNLSSEVFSALQGTDKILTLTSGNMQWSFYGENVTSVADVDLHVMVAPVENSESQNTVQIQKLLNSQDAIVLTFTEHTFLPGPAEITVKLTKEVQKILNSQRFNIYLYDERKDILTIVEENISLINDSLSLSIAHTNDYVVVPVIDSSSKSKSDLLTQQEKVVLQKEMELLSVRADKTEVIAPGSFVLIAEIWTKDSTIASCNACFDFHGDSLYYELRKNPATDNYECTVPFGPYVLNGEIYLDSIYVADNEGNCRNFRSNASSGDKLPLQVSVAVTNSHPELQDNLPPELISITAENTEITMPGSINLIAEINDNVSGVQSAQAIFSLDGHEDDYKENIYLNLFKTSELNTFKGEWDIPKYHCSGKYHLTSMVLVDHAENRITYTKNDGSHIGNNYLPSDLTINISNSIEKEDKLPPRLLSIKLEQENVKAPGNVKVIAELWDDVSGIHECNVHLFRDDKKGDWIYNKTTSLHKNVQTGLYEGIISFDRYTSNCVYIMSDVYIYDNSGRSSSYSIGIDPLVEEIKVTVENSNSTESDNEMPILKSLSADQKIVNAPGSFQISAEVSDDFSGVDFVSVSFNQQAGSGISAFLYQTENPNIFTGTCQVGAHKPSGIYSVSEVVVKDRAGHSTIYGGPYESVPNDLNIEIKNSDYDKIDTQGPTLTSITVDSTTVHAPGKVKIQADIQDDNSGVCSATANFSRNNNEFAVDTPIIVYLTKNELSNQFEGFLDIGSQEPEGKLRITRVKAVDKAGNESVYSRRDSGMYEQPLPNEPDITIINPDTENHDKDIPILYSVNTDKEYVTSPGSFTLSAELGEDESGILSVTAWLSDIPSWIRPATPIPVELKYNPKIGKFESKYDIPRNTEAKAIYLIQLDIRDQAGNIGSYFCEEYDIHGTRSNYFHEVKVEIKKDSTPPTLKSVKAEKTEINIPGSVKITADISDDISGVKESGCHLLFSISKRETAEISVPLKQNSETGKYEGILSFEKYTLSQDIPLISAIVEDNAGNIRKYMHKDNPGDGDTLPNDLTLHLKNPNPANNNLLIINDPLIENQSGVWVDGCYYPILKNDDMLYLDLPNENFHCMVTYDYHIGNAADPHTQYPTGMHVWILNCNDGIYTAERQPKLDNILIYAGSSIRIVGKKGIRMITGIETSKRESLISGKLAGYKLLEYGTALAWDTDLAAGNKLVLGASTTRSNYAYKRGVADPIFRYAGGQTQYTNVLVGFSNDDCKRDLAMRPYMILEDKGGKQVILYGGIIHRSIGYIAYQNRKAFPVGSAAYNYVWEIIHHVYGDQYDADYKE